MNLNIVNCSAAEAQGTGLAGCKIDRQRVVALGLVPKGYKFDEDKEWNQAYILELQQKGILIVLQGVTTFVDNTPEHNINTSAGSGIKRVMGKMPYDFLATFENGVAFSKALNTLDGHGNFDLVLFDVNSVIWLTKTVSGTPKAYALGMHSVGNYKGSDGDSVVANNTLNLQLTNRDEIDYRMSWSKLVDVDVDDLDGANNVTIEVLPAKQGDTSVVFTAILESDNHTSVEGLKIADLVVTKNDVSLIPSAITYANGKYTLTVSALATSDVIKIGFKQGTYEIILSEMGVLYQTKGGSVIVTAS